MRRELRPRAVLMEHTSFVRSRRYDHWNQPIKSTLPAVLTRQNTSNKLPNPLSSELKPLSAEPRPTTAPAKSVKQQPKEPSKSAKQSDKPLNKTDNSKSVRNKTFKQEVKPITSGKDESSNIEDSGSQTTHDVFSVSSKQTDVEVKAGKENTRSKLTDVGNSKVSPSEKSTNANADEQSDKTSKQGKQKSFSGKNKVQPL